MPAKEALKLPPEELAALMEVRLPSAQRLAQAARAFDAQTEIEEARALGARLIAWDDPDYPRLLLEGAEAPLLLYAMGSLTPEPAAVACVGSRRPTHYGEQAARALGKGLARAGVVVVSGLARGIDGMAHEGALEGQGRTWAVLGSGLNCVYPPEHEPLAKRIVEQGGCLLSARPLNSQPVPASHPLRNRIVAGLSWATVVVEGRMGSGSLITAAAAADLGREVWAVPGPAHSPLSEAPHYLLRHGAKLACSAHDILKELPCGLRLPDPAAPTAAGASTPPRPAARLAKGWSKIVELIDTEPRTLDELIVASGLDVSRLSHLLFEMELQGIVLPLPGQRYAKKGN